MPNFGYVILRHDFSAFFRSYVLIKSLPLVSSHTPDTPEARLLCVSCIVRIHSPLLRTKCVDVFLYINNILRNRKNNSCPFCFTTELQKLRDEQCSIQWNPLGNGNCWGRIFARNDIGHIYSTPRWRCYYERALTRDRRRYDTTKQSSCYHTTHNELKSITNEGKFGDKREGRCLLP